MKREPRTTCWPQDKHQSVSAASMVNSLRRVEEEEKADTGEEESWDGEREEERPIYRK